MNKRGCPIPQYILDLIPIPRSAIAIIPDIVKPSTPAEAERILNRYHKIRTSVKGISRE